jgi:protein involved in polysaccharide export with SLBB domain
MHRLLLLALGAFTLAGCSIAPGNRFTLFPQREELIPVAHEISQTNEGPPMPLPRELDKAFHKPYVVEPGDVLLVQPADLESPVRLPADQPILPDGTINLGRYGHLLVAGKTVPEIEVDVRKALQTQVKDVGPISVRLITRVSKVYYVLGEVNAPGSFPLQGRETVLDGILAAGGLTGRGSRCHIVLSRPTRPGDCRVVLPIKYSNIVQLGDTTTNYQLAPGDRIYVASRSFWENLTGHGQAGACEPVPQVPCALQSGHGPETAIITNEIDLPQVPSR